MKKLPIKQVCYFKKTTTVTYLLNFLLLFKQDYLTAMKQSSPPTPFRTDINGLRAYAVMAVLLFHFQIPGLSAGFIGVDIFFVISGFLMTGIIVKGLENKNFSVWKFYMARVRRIVPALMVLIAILLILGWLFLPTPDYQALGSQSAYASAFISNIYFWRSSGYFDAASHEKWLLHTWTLGVEAQFYLLLPLFLMVLWKIKPAAKTLFWGLLFAFFASLALSVVASSWRPVPAFYLLPTRGWEFIAGGLVFFAGRDVKALEKHSKTLLWSGFALLLLTFILIDSSYTWPSAWAVLPVLATALIMLANRSQSALTAHPIAQWLGDRSYSLYLWHWPIMVALYFAGLDANWLWISAGLALSLLLGNLSYRLIETPTRLYFSKASAGKEILGIGALVMLVGVSAVSARLFVFEGRLAPEVELAANEAVNKDPRKSQCHEFNIKIGSPRCSYGDGDIGAIVVGDSHAQSSITAVEKSGEKYDKSSLLHARSGCRQVLGTTKFKTEPVNSCKKLNEWILSDIKNYPSVPLVIINRSSAEIFGPNEDPEKLGKPTVYLSKKYFDSFDPDFLNEYKNAFVSSICSFSKTNRAIYLVRPYPEMIVNVPNTIARNIIFSRGNKDIKITLEEYHKRHAFVWQAQDLAAEQCGVKILNPLPYLCDDQYCYGSKNGRPLYYDDYHLSEYGNTFLVPMFEQVFTDQQSIPQL